MIASRRRPTSVALSLSAVALMAAAALGGFAGCSASPHEALPPESPRRTGVQAKADQAEIQRAALAEARSIPADPALGTDSYYEQQISLLRQSDSVIPPTLENVHPVTASYNREAIIPPQCYTRTEGVHNPCYVCHQDTRPGLENRMDDGDLQEAYTFSDIGIRNHWRNLFEDRSARVAQISDAAIIAWVNGDNYSELAPRLQAAGHRGWIPDLADLEQGAAAFDADGFARDGSGWVAFNYMPMPSTFWPTNGSTDDVMIRLSPPFRRTAEGEPSRSVYRANLAIVEATIKGLDKISVAPVDEVELQVDLNGDGQLTKITSIERFDHFVGEAVGHPVFPGIYPLNTEFLHSVRYLGFDDEEQVTISRRMKELRYMRKAIFVPQVALAERYREEHYAKDAGELPGYARNADGLYNGMGWEIRGFIEAPSGKLRVATYEENLFCMGCHTSIGATIDKTFSFARKPDGAAGWGYIDLKKMTDVPSKGESRGEIATYLERVGGGGEFRSNPEMQARFFDSEGRLREEALRAADNVYQLLVPSKARALELNKAYRLIVADQDFIFGRDATVQPPANVYEEIDEDKAPTLPEERRFEWNIQLDWRPQTTQTY